MLTGRLTAQALEKIITATVAVHLQSISLQPFRGALSSTVELVELDRQILYLV